MNGAQERTRTSTSIRTLASEASASTNSATWAGAVRPGRILGKPMCQLAKRAIVDGELRLDTALQNAGRESRVIRQAFT